MWLACRIFVRALQLNNIPHFPPTRPLTIPKTYRSACNFVLKFVSDATKFVALLTTPLAIPDTYIIPRGVSTEHLHVRIARVAHIAHALIYYIWRHGLDLMQCLTLYCPNIVWKTFNWSDRILHHQLASYREEFAKNRNSLFSVQIENNNWFLKSSLEIAKYLCRQNM